MSSGERGLGGSTNCTLHLHFENEGEIIFHISLYNPAPIIVAGDLTVIIPRPFSTTSVVSCMKVGVFELEFRSGDCSVAAK